MKLPTLILLALALRSVSYEPEAGAALITINEETATVHDFTINWGDDIFAIREGFGTRAADGNLFGLAAHMGRNPNAFLFQILGPGDFHPLIGAFTISFWGDPEYLGPVPMAYGSPNISFGNAIGNVLNPEVSALEGNPYAARFVLRSTALLDVTTSAVPDAGSTGWLLALGLCALRKTCGRMADAK